MKKPRIIHSLEEMTAMRPRRSAVAIGVFDGVHKGHREIIRRLVKCKETKRAEGAYLVTFNPHPVTVTHSRIIPPILTTIEERLDLFAKFDLDGVFVVRFDDTIARMDYRYFVEKYLLKAMKMECLIIGYDFHLGKDRSGSPEKLQRESLERGFYMEIVPPVRLEGVIVSSTQIRNEIMEGNFSHALDLLGHPYLLSGKVIRGHGKGAKLGFPTANLSMEDPYKLWPSRGVYAVEVKVKNSIYAGMMNIGASPTMKNLEEGMREIEVHLFDFHEDIHGERMFVYCHEYMRAEKRFPDAQRLVKQLAKDREDALKILSVGKREAAK